MASTQLPPELERAFRQHPRIRKALDQDALAALARADRDRAAEVVEDLVTKPDVRNPSAFVSSSLAKHPRPRGRKPDYGEHQFAEPQFGAPGSLEDVFARYPWLQQDLDDQALNRLQEVELERAVEIIEDLAQKTDVRNPSAFVAKALGRFPQVRGSTAFNSSAPEDTVLLLYPEIASLLDDRAKARIREADPARAEQVLQDISEKGDVHNPSAFVTKALSFPARAFGAVGRENTAETSPDGRDFQGGGDLEGTVLDYFPEIAAELDQRATDRLLDADAERAEEILQDIATKGDVRNPSAFVMRALDAHPHKRGGGTIRAEAQRDGRWQAPQSGSQVDDVLNRYPDIQQQLDGAVLVRLQEADPARVEEVLQDMSARGDIQNPSAFIMKALASSRRSQPEPPRQRTSWLDRLLDSEPGLKESLDDNAMSSLKAADPARALEVVEDILNKRNVRNPSAFIAASLAKYPQPRGGRFPSAQPANGTDRRHSGAHDKAAVHRSGGRYSDDGVDRLLQRYPRIRSELDEVAIVKLKEADVDRAEEILYDIAARGDIRNPAAFVVKAVAASRHKRSRDEAPSRYSHSEPPQKHQRTGDYRGSSDRRRWQDRGLERRAESLGMDAEAVRQVLAADPARAEEVLNELEAKGAEVRNPSAFVCRSLQQYRAPRGDGRGGY